MTEISSFRRRVQRTVAIAGSGWVMVASAHAAISAPDIAITWGASGLSTLRQGGTDLLYQSPSEPYYSTLIPQTVHLQRPDGTTVPTASDNGQSHIDTTGNRITRKYAWGTLQGTFIPSGDHLDIAITVTNTSNYIIDSLRLQLLTIRFPRTAKGFDGAGKWTHDVGMPGVIWADYGTGTLAATIDGEERPLVLCFANSIDPPGNRAFQLQVSTEEIGARAGFPGPAIHRPIYPGGTDQYHLSLHFGVAGATVESLAAETYRSFAARYPRHVDWKDRRPIGTLHLSTSEPNSHSPSNPRGWFMDPKGVDITTTAGRAQFRERLLKYADDSIHILKGMGAQGMILWDVEGQEYPHATSYLGDPRSLPPEMEANADAFFQKFRDAGLRVGMTLRPQQPVRAAYGSDVQQVEGTDPAKTLLDKIAYAQKRWGCTLFYVDSNVHFDTRRAGTDGDAYRLLDTEIFHEVAAAHPDVLLMPEQENTRYYAYTAPYNELRGGNTGTPADVRAVYPDAFSVIYVPDGPLDAHLAELTESVRRGDILLFRAWFDDTYNARIKRIYGNARPKTDR